MTKQEILEKYKNQDDRILVSRLFDKFELCNKKNKIQTLDFLNPLEEKILAKVIFQCKFSNYIFFGGYENSQRKMLIIYPEKLNEVFINGKFDYNALINIIRIKLPKENAGKYDHKVYLGGLIKLGIKREKIGDIIIKDDVADIIINSEITKFIIGNIIQLKRFSNCEIDIKKIDEIISVEQNMRI